VDDFVLQLLASFRWCKDDATQVGDSGAGAGQGVTEEVGPDGTPKPQEQQEKSAEANVDDPTPSSEKNPVSTAMEASKTAVGSGTQNVVE
jgi:hypothetical protein